MKKYIVIIGCLFTVGLLFAQIPQNPLATEQMRLRQWYANRNLTKKAQIEKRQLELEYVNNFFNGGYYTDADAAIALAFSEQNQRITTIESKINLLNENLQNHHETVLKQITEIEEMFTDLIKAFNKINRSQAYTN